MHQSSIIILGIESSCDDTAAAVISNGKVLANIIANQEVHKKYGGVVPELASRAHQQNIVPVVDAALKKAGISKNDITAVAYTNGPGLLGSLLVGSSFAKTLSIGLDIPAIAVNHMQGHILAHFIKELDEEKEMPEFPFLCLTVSGGHTQIVKVDDFFKMKVIGETIDDAAGEAFDKVAKMLQLPYPGGPLVDKYAKEGNPDRFSFPHPKVDELNFSFSGLKTAASITIRENDDDEQTKADIAHAFQTAVIDTLVIKCKRALKQTGIKRLVIAGGVSANTQLRLQLERVMQGMKGEVYYPRTEFCTDNGAMIAYAGMQRLKAGQFATLDMKTKPRWPIDSLEPI